MKKVLLSLILIWLCSSCASIMTGKRSNVKISTNKNMDLVVDGDTIRRPTNEPLQLTLRNSKYPLPITVIDGENEKMLGIRARKPYTYWLNAIPTIYLAGFLVDEITGLKWRYPRKIYIQSDSLGIRHLPYIPMDESLLDQKNKLTFSPLAIVNGYHPAFEFGYERLHGTTRATHIGLGIFRSWDNEYARNSTGFKAVVEEKFYVRNQEKSRLYASLVLEYIHKDHDANLNFEVLDAQGNLSFPRTTFIRSTRIEKRFISLVPRIGMEIYVTPRLIAEGFIGMGLRARRVRHQSSPAMARHFDDFGLFFFDTPYLSNRQTRNTGLNIDFNFRLAYTF